MRKAHFLGHAAGIVNIAARTTGAFLGQSRAMIIKLQGHAHDIIAFLGQFCSHDRAIHAARHRHHNAGFRRGFCKSKRVERLVKRHKDHPIVKSLLEI